MLTVLVVPDGAAESLGPAPTSLERARTPNLDRLASQGTLLRVRTIPEGPPAGTEVGLPHLLGAPVTAPPSRGRIEAAAAGVTLAEGEAAWRLDLVPPHTPDARAVARIDAALRPLGGRVRWLRGHRLLLLGPAAWGDGPPGPHQTAAPLAAVVRGPFAQVAEVASAAAGREVVAWPWGALGADPWPDLPTLLGRSVTVVTTGPAATGIARLLGCDVICGGPEVAVEVAAGAPDDALVVAHDPEPDEAAHAGDAAAKQAALERLDRLVIGPLARVVAARNGTLVVCPDHGCDPTTGRHTAAPVPAVRWPLGHARGADAARMTERLASHRCVVSSAGISAELTTQAGGG